MKEVVKEVTTCVYMKKIKIPKSSMNEALCGRGKGGGSINLEVSRQWARGDGRSDGGHVLSTSVHPI